MGGSAEGPDKADQRLKFLTAHQFPIGSTSKAQ
jgi:hypothetical protein